MSNCVENRYQRVTAVQAEGNAKQQKHQHIQKNRFCFQERHCAGHLPRLAVDHDVVGLAALMEGHNPRREQRVAPVDCFADGIAGIAACDTIMIGELQFRLHAFIKHFGGSCNRNAVRLRRAFVKPIGIEAGEICGVEGLQLVRVIRLQPLGRTVRHVERNVYGDIPEHALGSAPAMLRDGAFAVSFLVRPDLVVGVVDIEQKVRNVDAAQSLLLKILELPRDELPLRQLLANRRRGILLCHREGNDVVRLQPSFEAVGHHRRLPAKCTESRCLRAAHR